MTEYAIRLKDITKSYNMYAKPSDRFREALNPFKKSYHDVFYALKNVNVEIKKGEISVSWEKTDRENLQC